MEVTRQQWPSGVSPRGRRVELKDAAVLVGGFGTRLRSAVPNLPKPLAPVGGRPFVTFLLDHLEKNGIERVILCTGFCGEKVREVIGTRYGRLRIVYSQEREALGTGGALKRAVALQEGHTVLALNGDSFCDFYLADFLDWHSSRASKCSVVLAYVPDASRFGSVRIGVEGLVEEFCEKQPYIAGGWINAGVYLISRDILEQMPAEIEISLEREVFPGLVGDVLYGYQGCSRFIDIGTPESLSTAESFFGLNQ